MKPRRYARLASASSRGAGPSAARVASDHSDRSGRVGQTAVWLGGAIWCYGLATAVFVTTTSLFLADAVRAPPLLVGLFFAGYAAVGIVVNMTIGWLSDRLRERRAMLGISAMAGTAGSVIFMVARSYAVVFAVGVVFFSLSLVCFAQLFAYAKEFAEATGRTVTSFNSAMRAVFSAAWVAGPPFGFYLLTRFGFGPMYAATAGLFLATAVLGRWCLPAIPPPPEPRAGQAPGADPRRYGRRLRAVLAALPRPTWLLLGAIAALGVADQMYTIAIALYVTKDLHLPTALAGWLAGASAALETPVMIAVGRVADRIGRLRVVTVAAVVATVFFCLLPAAGSVPVLLALQLPNAAWTAVVLSIPMVMVQQEAPGGPGASSALYSSTRQAAILLAGAITGITAAEAGYRSVFWICAGLCVLATALLLSRAASRSQQPQPAPHQSPGKRPNARITEGTSGLVLSLALVMVSCPVAGMEEGRLYVRAGMAGAGQATAGIRALTMRSAASRSTAIPSAV